MAMIVARSRFFNGPPVRSSRAPWHIGAGSFEFLPDSQSVDPPGAGGNVELGIEEVGSERAEDAHIAPPGMEPRGGRYVACPQSGAPQGRQYPSSIANADGVHGPGEPDPGVEDLVRGNAQAPADSGPVDGGVGAPWDDLGREAHVGSHEASPRRMSPGTRHAERQGQRARGQQAPGEIRPVLELADSTRAQAEMRKQAAGAERVLPETRATAQRDLGKQGPPRPRVLEDVSERDFGPEAPIACHVREAGALSARGRSDEQDQDGPPAEDRAPRAAAFTGARAIHIPRLSTTSVTSSSKSSASAKPRASRTMRSIRSRGARLRFVVTRSARRPVPKHSPAALRASTMP